MSLHLCNSMFGIINPKDPYKRVEGEEAAEYHFLPYAFWKPRCCLLSFTESK